LKLDIIENDPVHDLLAGMAMGLLIQIYNSKLKVVSLHQISFYQKYRIVQYP